MVEIEKVLEELKEVMKARDHENQEESRESEDILALCLSTRKNLCIHKEIS